MEDRIQPVGRSYMTPLIFRNRDLTFSVSLLITSIFISHFTPLGNCYYGRELTVLAIYRN